MMGAAQMKRGLVFLSTHGWVRLPHGVVPLDKAFASAAAWQSNVWNPRGGGRDPDASRKPTWAEISKAAGQAVVYDRGQVFRAAARAETRRRICDVYGAKDIQDEILKRLRGDHTVHQHTMRDALRERYKALMDSDAPYTRVFEPSMLDTITDR